jgi:hypothetical protein
MTRLQNFWDRCGIFISFACLLHCLLLPVLLIAFPALEIESTPFFHRIMLIAIISIALFSFRHAYFKMFKPVIFFSLAGIFLVVTGYFVEESVSENWGHALTILGSFCMIGAHAVNLEWHKKNNCC